MKKHFPRYPLHSIPQSDFIFTENKRRTQHQRSNTNESATDLRSLGIIIWIRLIWKWNTFFFFRFSFVYKNRNQMEIIATIVCVCVAAWAQCSSTRCGHFVFSFTLDSIVKGCVTCAGIEYSRSHLWIFSCFNSVLFQVELIWLFLIGIDL